MSALKKVVRVGTVPIWNRRASLFAKIKYTEDGQLSIPGVEGPMKNGDAVGSGCAQPPPRSPPAPVRGAAREL